MRRHGVRRDPHRGRGSPSGAATIRSSVDDTIKSCAARRGFLCGRGDAERAREQAWPRARFASLATRRAEAPRASRRFDAKLRAIIEVFHRVAAPPFVRSAAAQAILARFNPSKHQGIKPIHDDPPQEPPRLGRTSSATDQPRPDSLVRRHRAGVSQAPRRNARQRHAARAQPIDLPRLLPASLGSRGRRTRRASDLRLHDGRRGRGPEQQLEGAGRGQDAHGVVLRGLHARPHDVRDPVLHGADRLALCALRRRDHGQRLRRREHVSHDAHRQTGAQTHREGQDVRQRAPLDGRARPDAPLHHALPRGAHDHELRLGLRRQRVARQEVPRAAHRELPGAHRRLARRAHADRRRAEPRRRHSLSRLRVPIGVRQDQSRDADPAREPARAGRSGRSATTSRGCISMRTVSCARSIPKPATSASCRARTRKRTATPTT